MPRLALYLLGPPRAELDGEEVRFPRRKAVALLAYLAATGRCHSRDSLATLLWPELDQSTARAPLAEPRHRADALVDGAARQCCPGQHTGIFHHGVAPHRDGFAQAHRAVATEVDAVAAHGPQASHRDVVDPEIAPSRDNGQKAMRGLVQHERPIAVSDHGPDAGADANLGEGYSESPGRDVVNNREVASQSDGMPGHERGRGQVGCSRSASQVVEHHGGIG